MNAHLEHEDHSEVDHDIVEDFAKKYNEELEKGNELWITALPYENRYLSAEGKELVGYLKESFGKLKLDPEDPEEDDTRNLIIIIIIIIIIIWYLS